MSHAFVVCQSADDAAKMCLALQTASKQQDNCQRFERPSRREKPKSKKSLNGKSKPYKERNSRRNNARKAARIDAPVLSDMMVLGDSIAVRFARQQLVFAPKYMKLCFGGATFQSLQKAVNDFNGSLLKNVCVIVGMNNIIKNIEVAEDVVTALISSLKEKGADKVFFVTIPPMCREQAYSDQIVKTNALLSKFNSNENSITVIDVFPSFLNGEEVNQDLFEKFYYNGQQDLIHPNANGLQKIADNIFEYYSQ